MFQTIQGKKVFVVELKTFPPRLPINGGDDVALIPYAQALQAAIDNGIVTGPGKYAIEVIPHLMWWNIFAIQE